MVSIPLMQTICVMQLQHCVKYTVAIIDITKFVLLQKEGEFTFLLFHLERGEKYSEEKFLCPPQTVFSYISYLLHFLVWSGA